MNLKDLLTIAKSELNGLSTLANPDFRLEQAEYKEDESIWEVVVSYLVENTNKRVATTPLAQLTSDFQYHRIYKKLKINANKEVVGLYIYNN